MKQLILILIAFIPSFALAQSQFSKLYDINNDAETGIWVSQNGDKTAVLVGALCNNNTSNCVEILRLDETGEIVWALLLDSMDVVFANNLVTTDEYIYFSGPKTGMGRFGVKVLQFDWDGNFIRSIDLTDQYPVSVTTALSIVDSSLVLLISKRGAGEPYGITPDTSYFYFMDFGLNYQRQYKHSSGVYRYERAHSLKKAADGSGYYCERWSTHSTWGDTCFLDILKLDALGNIIWIYSAEPGTVNLQPSIATTLDGGVVASWHKEDWETIEPINPEPSKLLKLNTEGELEWEHTFNSTYVKNIVRIFTAQNGNIICVGEEYLFETGLIPYTFLPSGWVMSVSPEDGEVIWSRNIVDTSLLVSPFGMRLFSGAETPEGDLIFTGPSYSLFPNGIPVLYNPDTWVVRTDSEGCVIAGCGPLELVSSLDQVPAGASGTIKVWPVPATEKIWVSDEEGRAQWRRYLLASPEGKQLQQGQIASMPLELSFGNQPAGLYFLTLIAAEGQVITLKILKQ